MIPSRAQAEVLLMNAATEKGKLQSRLEAVKRKISVEMDSVANNKVDPETDRTYTYYRSERERVSKKMDTENTLIDIKIQALEAKKAAFCDMINAQIEALSNKKDSTDSKLRGEDMRYFSEMERIRSKLENPEPTTASFKRLKSDLTTIEQEIIDADKKYGELLLVHATAREKEDRRLEREAAQQIKEALEHERRERERALKIIEAQQEQTRKEEAERAKARVEEAKQKILGSLPAKPKKVIETIELPLIDGKGYSFEQLCSIDQDDLSDDQLKIYEKAYATAIRIEKIPGWWDNPLNARFLEEE